ncbi:chromatin assembly factor 1 subunit A [Drosophila biarmipes]|uniref:chromatin assembly factor 1 subunit A n=1 Tax=Drosophila biarmipes TaxID=125945 RepID=UPI0007E787CD|nr:chromatin assembly factor 1 subunit A [Drosophila biarmipes]
MPAGIVKTPISGRTKEAAVAKSAERTASGGKKFVQTRLPFKLLTPGGGAGAETAVGGAASGASSSAGDPVFVILDEKDPAPRKRKLSYGDETPLEGTGCSAGQLRRSNSKENLDLSSSIATKKVKTADSVAEDVIELDDDDDRDDGIVEKKEEVARETKEVKPKPKKASPAPIQIKLPLVNKRSKRRKSLKKSEEALDTSPKETAKTGSESSDDIEALAEELNPQKKQKVQKPLKKAPEIKHDGEEEGARQKEEEASKKQEEPRKTAKESKKEEPKGVEHNKKNDQSTIDLFIAKKVDSSKKEEPEAKKKDQSVAEDPKQNKAPKKDSIKTLGKPKAESKPVEKSKKDEKEAGTTKSQKEKEDAAAKNQKEETKEKNAEPEKATSKKAESADKERISKQAKKEEPAAQEKSDKGSPEAAEISLILSSSDENSSSSEHEMDVDTDTAAGDRTSAQKDALLQRKSLPEASDTQKTLTPKQQRLLERRKKAREEKEQKLAEERRLKQQEKEQREQQKKQERDEKEQQRKLEKDQKEQQRKMEKEEKERKRQAEMDSKNEEKRKRNEAKEEVQRKKDEERRKKEQEREEAEQKKKRAAESFSKFFVPKQPKAGGGSNNTSYLEHEQSSCDSSKASSQTLAFRPFQIKDDMLLAPIVRASLGGEQRSQLDGLFRFLEEEDDEEEDIVRRKPPSRAHLYLSELSSGRREPLKMQRDARLQRRTKDDEEEDEVQVIDDLSNAGLPIEVEQPKQLARMRAKYLHFADNRRPPYYGTWRKKSGSISARRPLAQDKVHFDYELDSDCEWEEEEPGESLSASEDEKERESEEESEEEYNEWYVPHGHLSDEELQNDGEIDDGHTREAQKAKLQVLQQEFAQEMKKQTKKIKPRLLGPVWLDENGNPSQLFPAMFAHTIDMYACWQMEPLSLEPPEEPEREDQLPEQPVPLQLDDRLMQQLVRLTHGNRNSKMFLINEYLEYLKTQAAAESSQTVLPSKAVLRERFDELASWKTVELGTPEAASGSSAKKTKKPKKRLCWVVANDMLEKFQLPELPLQNQWDYTLTPKISEGADAPQHEQSPPAEVEASASPVVAAVANSAPTTPIGEQTPSAAQGAKKRATLIMSVPRDHPIHPATKNKLISQFLRRRSDASNPKEKKPEKPPPAVSDDVVMLSD